MTSTKKDFWRAIGMLPPANKSQLVPVRFRMDEQLANEVERIVAYARDHGYSINKSDVLRVAVQGAVDGFKSAVPDLRDDSSVEDDLSSAVGARSTAA